MTITDRAALVTGASRGIGQALVDGAMADSWRSGAAKALERQMAVLVNTPVATS